MTKNVFRKSMVIGIIILFVGASSNSVIGNIDYLKIKDKIYINNDFEKINNDKSQNILGWTEEFKLIPSDSEENPYSRTPVEIDGDYAIFGNPINNNENGEDAGAAYVFKRSGSTWTEQVKLLASDGAAGDSFGTSVSIDGDYAIIGSPYDEMKIQHPGSAYIFKRDGNSWIEEAKLTASDEEYGMFGYSVSLDGDYVIIGAIIGPYTNDGSAYVFKRSGSTWIEKAKLIPSDIEPSGAFGSDVSINGDYAIVGAALDENENGEDAGSAFVFKRSDSTWIEQFKLWASDGAEYDYFGISVSIDGDYAIIGADENNNEHGEDAGAAYVFKRSGSTWTEQVKLLASDGDHFDWFGCSVSIDGDYAIVGAYGADDGGAAFVFKRSGSTWTEQAILIASDVTIGDKFGDSVDFDGERAIISAPSNGHGAAYVFNKEGGNQPPVADAGGPYSGYVGDLITFDGSNSYDPDNKGIFGFRWDFNGDSIWDTVWTLSPISAFIYTTAMVGEVILQVLDNNGATDTHSTTVTITNRENQPYFIQISDVHYGYNGYRSNFRTWLNDKLNNCYTKIGYYPSLVLITGDLVSFGNNACNWWDVPAFYLAVEEESNSYSVLKSDLDLILGPRDISYIVCPGNHDYYCYSTINPFVSTDLSEYSKVFNNYMPKTSHYVEGAEVNILVISSENDQVIPCMNPPMGTGLSDSTMPWLENNIRSDAKNIVLMHHPTILYKDCSICFPFYNCDEKWGVGCIEKNKDHFINVCSDYVDLVLSGHIHDTDRRYTANQEYYVPDGYSSEQKITTESTVYAVTGKAGYSFRLIFVNDEDSLDVFRVDLIPDLTGNYIYAGSQTTQEYSNCELTGSGVQLHAYDEFGNHVGINDTGGFDFEIEGATQYLIPVYGSSGYNYDNGYLMWNHTIEEISVPNNENNNYEIKATKDTDFDLVFDVCSSDGSVIRAYFNEIPLYSTSIGKIAVDENNYDFVINFDDDGDGIDDRSLQADGYELYHTPIKPERPVGVETGSINEFYEFSTTTSDPENDFIFYLFDWGNDDFSDWLGPFQPGESCKTSHSWSEKGTFEIKVKAKDIYDFESAWSDPLTVTITKSKNKTIHTLPFLNFLTNHPNLFPILQRLILRLGLQ